MQNDQRSDVPVSDRDDELRFHGLRIYVLAGLLLLLFVIGLLLFLRPDFSASEKRDLTPFPDFSVDAFLSGEYFSQINTWYADTFPGREALLKINDAIHGLFGVSLE